MELHTLAQSRTYTHVRSPTRHTGACKYECVRTKRLTWSWAYRDRYNSRYDNNSKNNSNTTANTNVTVALVSCCCHVVCQLYAARSLFHIGTHTHIYKCVGAYGTCDIKRLHIYASAACHNFVVGSPGVNYFAKAKTLSTTCLTLCC